MPWMNEDIEKLFKKLDRLIELLTPIEITVEDTLPVVKKKMGRPKGSKNKHVKRTSKS